MRLDPKLRRLPLLGLLLLAGCEGDTASLIREIDAAREGCTEEKLKAGAEECVRMMERYAEMGTEAMETYIGAVKSLDEALRRMPPPQFDTAGLGRALSLPAGAAPAWGDTSAAARGLFAPAPDDVRTPSSGWGSPAYPRDPRYEPYPAYGDDRGSDPYPPYAEDPRYPEGAWYGDDPRYADPRYVDPRYLDPRYADPRYADPAPYGEPYPVDPYSRQGLYDPRDPYGVRGAPRPGPYGPEERWRDRRRGDPPAAPPARGRLLPPEQRLRRPWLEEERRREPDFRRDPRLEWRDTLGRRR